MGIILCVLVAAIASASGASMTQALALVAVPETETPDRLENARLSIRITDTDAESASQQIALSVIDPGLRGYLTLKFVTYYINFSSVNSATGEEKLVLSGRFYSEQGNLTLDVRQPEAGKGNSIEAAQEPYYNAWVADAKDSIVIRNANLTSGQLQASIKILGVDNVRTLLPASHEPVFDVRWTSGAMQGVILDETVSPVFAPEFPQLALLALAASTILFTLVSAHKARAKAA